MAPHPYMAVVDRYIQDKQAENERILRESAISMTDTQENFSSEQNQATVGDKREGKDDRSYIPVVVEHQNVENVRGAEMAGQAAFNRTNVPIVHWEVFLVSIARESNIPLQRWIGSAAFGTDCPADFQFPTVGATIPQVWRDAYFAMDTIIEARPSQPFVLWNEAVNVFKVFMEGERKPLDQPADVLLRAMQHREYEGGVILVLDSSVAPEAARGMLHLNPTWLVNLVRRLTDHNLMDESKDGQLKEELEEFGKKLVPPVDLAPLWEQHL